MPDLKEPRFFASDMRPPSRPAVGAAPRRSPSTWRCLHSPNRASWWGRPHRLPASHTAAARFQTSSPARIIAILREPASFLRSLHLQLLAPVESENDLAPISLEEARREGRQIPRRSHPPAAAHMYSDHVRYVEHLQRYDARRSRRSRSSCSSTTTSAADNEGTVGRCAASSASRRRGRWSLKEANPTVIRMRSQNLLDELVNVISVGRGPPVSSAPSRPASRCSTTRASCAPARCGRRAAHFIYGKPQPADEQPDASSCAAASAARSRSSSEYLDRDLVSPVGL